MNSRLGKRWIAAGVIWVVVFSVTAWNSHLVRKVHAWRQELQTLWNDQDFIHTHHAEMQAVFRQKDRLSHPVKSFSLGFVVVENNLKRLSWDFGLQQLRVEADQHTHGTHAVPITIFAIGTVPSVVRWVAAIEEQYPYLAVEKMDVTYDSRKRVCQLQATFSYYYVVSNSEWTG
jgi:hypothetical protein